MSFTKLIEKAAKRQLERYEQQKEVSAKLAEDLKQLFVDVPNLEKIVIKAYTPGFNDGDPCTHNQREPGFYIKNSDWIAGQAKDEDSSEEDEDEDDDDYYEENWYLDSLIGKYSSKKNKISSDVASKLKHVESLLIGAEDLFQEMFGTNWELIFTLNKKTQQIEVDHNEYDCGH